ncbi:TauD/TfdA family dioxygenase [Pseudomonas entomophila]|uniref:TauD/TfdA family dioxygenase n=1 Tax=Pseudomonas entomophila TaxID=312306 RepID=UPI0023D8AD88|nr:TauD/TfdA family dioxygenase [Pseudomonas entomophila]MDF0731326.1 TauD/TfdA family dioxygenase [Pseudomonas entomophila]
MQESEVAYLDFTPVQAQALSIASQSLAQQGGPQAPGVTQQAREHAQQLAQSLDPQQRATLQRFADGHLAALMYTGMPCPGDDPMPEELPALSSLEDDARCLHLAARNQLLLELVHYRAFAFDIDNEGKQVRLVGNFKGGGSVPRPDETQGARVELSSHAGLRLGPHTEAPYNCSVVAQRDHSPAPSALVLTARWNPANEPTHVTPMRGVIERLSGLQALALTSSSFDFTRSDCFVAGMGEPEQATSMLQFDANGGFALRYNSYRFSVNDHASQAAADAFDAFQTLVGETAPVPFMLQPDTALVINNCRALHGRDIVKDNRRLLVRLFGYSPFAQPVVICEDPLLVRG